ncbi:hypothetical protein [Planctomycetes bacterium K23_9]|uniref:hypothetical protein n=1 Tax=Stieleria marina TaxID=1930275 RepID=UPI0011A06838
MKLLVCDALYSAERSELSSTRFPKNHRWCPEGLLAVATVCRCRDLIKRRRVLDPTQDFDKSPETSLTGQKHKGCDVTCGITRLFRLSGGGAQYFELRTLQSIAGAASHPACSVSHNFSGALLK